MKIDKVRRLVVIALFLIVVFGIGVYLLISQKQFKQSKLTKQTSQPTATSLPDFEKSKYSVMITSISKTRTEAPYDISYEAKITNNSIEPYITNFAFYECNFIDNNNNKYGGYLMTEKSFDKAVLPGTSQPFSITTQPNLNGYDNHVNGFVKCDYQEDGSRVCSTVANIRINDCTAYISSDGKQASNGWGNNPINVEFPMPQVSFFNLQPLWSNLLYLL